MHYKGGPKYEYEFTFDGKTGCELFRILHGVRTSKVPPISSMDMFIHVMDTCNRQCILTYDMLPGTSTWAYDMSYMKNTRMHVYILFSVHRIGFEIPQKPGSCDNWEPTKSGCATTTILPLP